MRTFIRILPLNALPSKVKNTGTMAPKEQPKGKKGKLSKAEKEKLKKEEAEKKAQEEEDARLKAEQEEKERLERERLEREERERIEAAESQRHATEVNELRSMLEGNKTALLNMHEERRAKEKWDRYMRCDGSPDPTIAAEINTYINLWKEDKDRNTLDEVLKESCQTLDLIQELEALVADSVGEPLDDSTVSRYEETVVELENLLSLKTDAATVILLKGASDNADPETGNLQMINSNKDITMMLWGNLTKKRFKSFEFDNKMCSFELPKQLALSDIAIRVVHTNYDHFSHRCRTYRLKKKKKVVIVEEPLHEQEAEVKGDEKTAGESGEEEKQDGEEAEKEEGDRPEEVATEEATPDEQADNQAADSAEIVSQEVKEEADAVGDTEPEEEEDEEEEENDLEDEDTVDLRAYQVLGGVTHFDLLALPPQPKQVKGWIMTQVSSDELKRFPYPAAEAAKLNQTLSGTIAGGQTFDPKAVANAAAAAEALGAPPVGVTLKLPDNVLFSEEPQMAYWSPEGKHWRLDGFVDIKFDEAERSLSFKTINFGPLACIQDKHINMPFQSWELQPLGLNNVRLTIIAAILEVEIEIRGALCCFRLAPDCEPKQELDSHINKWMAPAELIKTMKSAGVDLFPEEDSKKYVSINEKDETLESSVYEQMALTASHFGYAWSKWNGESSAEKIVILGAEKLESTPASEEDWSLLMISRERVFKLKMGEYDEEFSEVFAEGTQFHADLFHMVKDLSSEAGLERMMTTDFRFIDSVYQILSATRIIQYS